MWMRVLLDKALLSMDLKSYLTILTACFYLDWSFDWIVLFDTEIVDDISGPNILRHHTTLTVTLSPVTRFHMWTPSPILDLLLSIISVQVGLNQSLIKISTREVRSPFSVTNLLSSAWDRLWPHAASHRSLSLLWWWWLGMSQSWAGPLWPGKIRP